MKTDVKNDQIESAAQKAVTLERSLIEETRAVNARIAEVTEAWLVVKEIAIEAYKQGAIDKSIKRPWGSMTITEGLEVDADIDKLDDEYKKTVVDTTKIRSEYYLHGKAPKGAIVSKTYGFRKSIKAFDDE